MSFNKQFLCNAKGASAEAIMAYRHILSQYPSHLASRYNLACLLAEQQDWAAAIREFEEVLNQEPTCTPACYNLAICWQGTRDDNKAAEYLEKTLTLDPQHALAAQALGSILLKQEHYAEAKTYLVIALQDSPTDPDIYYNLALACLGEGQKLDALYYFNELLKHHPYHIDAEYNCAVIYQQDGNYPAALRAYNRILELNPEHFASLYNSALIFQANAEYDHALTYYQRAYKIDPQHKSLAFLIQALQQQTPSKAPTEYIETLFDGYADHYDRHMQQQLRYSVPKQLFELFFRYAEHANVKQDYTLIDLGCGTGLAGEYFKPICDTMVGIDLSTHMLRQASRKQIYTTLNQQDNVEYLLKLKQDTDIIIAADVLGYYGDLNQLFSAVHQTLRVGGWFLFSIEAYAGEEKFHLQPHARFAHQPQYIESLAEQNGFSILAKQASTLRFQQEQPVNGYLYMLQLMH
ncbi:MAG: tetratricopeptide repeat protein [Gammaproteobacteria bacterium]